MWGGAQTPCATLESRGTWSLTLLPPPPGHQNPNFLSSSQVSTTIPYSPGVNVNPESIFLNKSVKTQNSAFCQSCLTSPGLRTTCCHQEGEINSCNLYPLPIQLVKCSAGTEF